MAQFLSVKQLKADGSTTSTMINLDDVSNFERTADDEMYAWLKTVVPDEKGIFRQDYIVIVFNQSERSRIMPILQNNKLLLL